MKAKLIGYQYQVIETYPIDNGNGYTIHHVRDNLEDAQKIVEVLESTDVNFSVYGILLHPVWREPENTPTPTYEEDEFGRRVDRSGGYDANGSPV